MPDIDILLPVRSPKMSWLGATLESLDSQTGVDARLVMVLHPDDGGLLAKLPKLTIPMMVVYAPAHGNLADALNVGLDSSTADFIARMDADDIAEPNRLDIQRKALLADEGCGAIGSNALLIDPTGEIVGLRSVPQGAEKVLQRMRWKASLIHPSAMFRRKLVRDIGGYSPEAEHVEDYELWLRILRHASIKSLPEPLIRYRIHDNQVTKTRGISRQASAAVCRARIELAKSRGESLMAARARHEVWAARQAVRRWTR